jgi:hypothetical protein
MRVQPPYRDLVLTGAFSVTGSGNTIQSPWGYQFRIIVNWDRDLI